MADDRKIEPGSEWLHKESLTVVTVDALDGVGAFRDVEFSHGDMHAKRIPESRFLRDYRPNVPVTPELLEGMGWDTASTLLLLSVSSCGMVELEWEDGRMLLVFDDWLQYPLPAPATLRDLLTLLRALGIETQGNAS